MWDVLTLLLLSTFVTIADKGRVFQPALSPDGSHVAYADESADGSVRILVASTNGDGRPARVADLGQGAIARRAATKALSAEPWSPDGSKLLFLKPSGSDNDASLALYVVRADGSDGTQVGDSDGTIDSAAWFATPGVEAIVYAHRKSASVEAASTVVVLEAATGKRTVAHAFTEPTTVPELLASPDGSTIALLCLSGDPDRRARSVQIVAAAGGKAPLVLPLDAKSTPNFLRCATADDRARFLVVDTSTNILKAFDTATGAPVNSIEDISLAVPAPPGPFVLARTPMRVLVAIDTATGDRFELGRGFAPTSCKSGKLSLVRTGKAGAAIFVVDVSEEGLRAGTLDLPNE